MRGGHARIAGKASGRGRGRMRGGEGGIRTHGTVAGTPHFECGAFDLSATSPREAARIAASFALAKRMLAFVLRLPRFTCMNLRSATPVNPKAPPVAKARFDIGDVVRHRHFDF